MDTTSTEETRHRRQAGDALRRWTEQGRPAGIVRVLERQGFGTVATGQLLAGTANGDWAGALFEGTMDTVALHGPVGLDVGASRPAETAVSVVGEVLAVRRGRSGGPLATAAGRIGG